MNSLQTRQLALHGDLNLGKYKPLSGFYVERGRETYSIYGSGISLVAVPFYWLLLRFTGSEAVLQGFVACVFVSAAVLFMLLLLQRIASRRLAVGGAVLFGFGTTLWPTASTALWQQGPAIALEVLALVAIFSEHPAAPLLAGFALGAAAFVRLPLLVLVAVFLAFYVTKGLRPGVLYAVGVLPWMVGRLIENSWLWGGPTHTGYSFEPQTLSTHLVPGLVGELFGWRRGLLIYSPVLVLAIIGITGRLRRFRTIEDRRYFFIATGSLLLVLLDASWSIWWGGERQFGYRLLLDAAPLLVILAIALLRERPAIAPVAIVLGFFSIIIMAAGSVPNVSAWDTDFQQGALSLSPLSHSLHAAIKHPGPVLWRLALVLFVGIVLTIATRLHANNVLEIQEQA